MALWVPALSGAAYEWRSEFGGFRKPDPSSPNTALRNASFRAYADYMQTPEFLVAFDDLMEKAKAERVAIMCSESLWWRCHRRIVTDYLLAAGYDVRHIMDHGKIEPATLTPGAEPQAGGAILYPAARAVSMISPA